MPGGRCYHRGPPCVHRSSALDPSVPPEPTPPPEPGSTPGPDDQPADGGPTEPPPGLFAQIGRLRDAVRRLLRAHIDLAKAEAGEILDEVKRVAALGMAAVLMLLIALLILAIGTALFVCEVLFGSMGWALLLAPLFYGALALAVILYALGVAPRLLGVDLLVGLVLGVLVALGLYGDLGTAIWGSVAEQIVPTLDPVLGRVLVAVVGIGLLGAIVAAIARGVRGGAGEAGRGFAIGLVVGAIVGLLMAVGVNGQVAAAIGTAVTLGAWAGLMGYRAANGGIDFEAFKARFIPQQSIDAAQETMEWARRQTPLGPR